MDAPDAAIMDDEDAKPHDKAADDAIQPPEAAHVREAAESPHTEDTDSDGEREDMELRDLQSHAVATLPAISHILSPGQPLIHWWDPMKRFWRHHIRISVPHVDCRDHLANERTYLGYLRNSIALAMMGILIAQLYRLEHSPHPSPVLGYFVLSKPLAIVFQSAALGMVLLGAIRFFRQQSAMAVGKVHAGGWEVIATALGFFLLLFMMLSVVIAVDIYHHFHPEQDGNT